MAAGSGGRGCQYHRSVSWPRFHTLPLPSPAVRCCLRRRPVRGLSSRCTSPVPYTGPLTLRRRAQPAPQCPISAQPKALQEPRKVTWAVRTSSWHLLSSRVQVGSTPHSFIPPTKHKSRTPALFWALEPHRRIRQGGPCSHEADTGLGEVRKPASRCTTVGLRLGSTLERVIKEGLPEEAACELELEGEGAGQARCWGWEGEKVPGWRTLWGGGWVWGRDD